MAKSARERLNAEKEPKKVLLEKAFAGVKKGQRLFVATPQIVAGYIREIPHGETRTIPDMRNELARRNECDATCPVSTAVFIRIVAQAAIDDMSDGMSESEVIPFWRLISGADKPAKKLTIDSDWIDRQRNFEAEQ